MLMLGGAELILTPNACPLANDPEIGDLRLAQFRARAWENLVAVAMANYAAPECDGSSVAYYPDGSEAARGDAAERVVLATIDLERVRAFRRREEGRDAARRPECYAAIAAHCGPLGRALDLGCGTGLSTRALRDRADWVVGIDPSRSMLGAAAPADGVAVALARAEALPLAAGSVDLVAIGCAFHWCERAALLCEVARVLRPGGRFAIYDSEFQGDEGGGILDWLRASYWSQLPYCPRQPYFSPEEELEPPFRLDAAQDVLERARMSLDDVVGLITSQASTIHAIERGALDLPGAEAHLRDGLAPFFRGLPPRSMLFRSPLAILRRA